MWICPSSFFSPNDQFYVKRKLWIAWHFPKVFFIFIKNDRAWRHFDVIFRYLTYYESITSIRSRMRDWFKKMKMNVFLESIILHDHEPPIAKKVDQKITRISRRLMNGTNKSAKIGPSGTARTRKNSVYPPQLLPTSSGTPNPGLFPAISAQWRNADHQLQSRANSKLCNVSPPCQNRGPRCRHVGNERQRDKASSLRWDPAKVSPRWSSVNINASVIPCAVWRGRESGISPTGGRGAKSVISLAAMSDHHSRPDDGGWQQR